MSDVTDQQIIEQMQREIDVLEEKLADAKELLLGYMKYNRHGRGCECELHKLKALLNGDKP